MNKHNLIAGVDLIERLLIQKKFELDRTLKDEGIGSRSKKVVELQAECLALDETICFINASVRGKYDKVSMGF